MANTSPIRHTTLSGREVIYAAHRQNRPHSVETSTSGEFREKACPFCPGNEAMLPDILWEQDDSDSWRTRAVSNLYPIVTPPNGHHEIIIDTPDHVLPVGAMSPETWGTILDAYSARLRALSGRWSYVSLFRNVGRLAGGSIEHPHSQLIALDYVPIDIELRLNRLRVDFSDVGHCDLCTATNLEPSFSDRIVTQNSLFVAFSPETAEVPFEIWVAPRRHSSDFFLEGGADEYALAEVLSDIFNRMTAVLGDFDHNMMLMDTSRDQLPYLHWFLRIRPVGEPIGGFERATGIAVNTSSPERDAMLLKQAYAIPDMDSV